MLRVSFFRTIRSLSYKKENTPLYNKLNHEDIAALKYVTNTSIDEDQLMKEYIKKDKKVEEKNNKKKNRN